MMPSNSTNGDWDDEPERGEGSLKRAGSAKPLSGRQEAYTDYIRSLGDVTKAWTDAEWSICHAAFIQGWWTRGGDDPNSPNDKSSDPAQ